MAKQKETLLRLLGGLACLVIAGLSGTYLVWTPWNRANQAKSWPPTSCRVLSSEIKEVVGQTDTPPSYFPEIRYSYTFNGRSYEGDRYYFGSFGGEKETVNAILAGYKPGQECVAFVNPTAPEEAVLDRSLRVSSLAIVLTSGFAFFGLCLLAAVKSR